MAAGRVRGLATRSLTLALTHPALCYHGLLRVGTGLSLLDGMIEVDKEAEGIDVPIRLVHGNADRATDYHGTEKLFARLPNKDKQIKIYDGYEHGESTRS